jgi:hypothetical protein
LERLSHTNRHKKNSISAKWGDDEISETENVLLVDDLVVLLASLNLNFRRQFNHGLEFGGGLGMLDFAVVVIVGAHGLEAGVAV